MYPYLPTTKQGGSIHTLVITHLRGSLEKLRNILLASCHVLVRDQGIQIHAPWCGITNPSCAGCDDDCKHGSSSFTMHCTDKCPCTALLTRRTRTVYHALFSNRLYTIIHVSGSPEQTVRTHSQQSHLHQETWRGGYVDQASQNLNTTFRTCPRLVFLIVDTDCCQCKRSQLQNSLGKGKSQQGMTHANTPSRYTVVFAWLRLHLYPTDWLRSQPFASLRVQLQHARLHDEHV